jgi:pimeloyl-ACP methyl ester carboxylesterase
VYIETPDGVRLRCCDRGEGDTAVVLVHGWKQSHRQWDQTIFRMQDRHRVVACDTRGMGESDKPDSSMDFHELAGDLGHVIRTLGLRDVTLVGWSMGCSISLQYLLDDGHGVGRVVLMNGPIRLTQSEDFPHTMTEEELFGYLDGLEAGWPTSEREFQSGGLRDPDNPALVDLLYGIALQTPLDLGSRVVRHQVKLDHRDAVAGLKVPVLAAYGRHDPYYPTSLADWIADRAPDGRAVIFEESAHNPPFEEPARFVEVLEEFIAATPGR